MAMCEWMFLFMSACGEAGFNIRLSFPVILCLCFWTGSLRTWSSLFQLNWLASLTPGFAILCSSSVLPLQLCASVPLSMGAGNSLCLYSKHFAHRGIFLAITELTDLNRSVTFWPGICQFFLILGISLVSGLSSCSLYLSHTELHFLCV